MGALASIRRPEELDVYLARGCDGLTVEVCPTLEGRERFHGLRRACEHSKQLMIGIDFPTTITNRIACAFAALSFGGRDLRHLAPWAASVSDFPTCKTADFDAYIMPTELDCCESCATRMSFWVLI